MKILLAYPWFLEERPDPVDVAPAPMGLYYVAAALESAGFSVSLHNWHDRDLAHARRVLAGEKPDLVGFSILHGNRFGALDAAAAAKTLDPSVPVVLGGPGASFLWELYLSHYPQVDYVVRGEGEAAMTALARGLKLGEDVSSIPGLVFRDAGGKPVANPPAPPVKDLDSLPEPAASHTFAHVALSRGCAGNCSFCGSPALWGRRVRFHSAEVFAGRIKTLAEKGVTHFYVSDDTFTLNKKRAMAACQKVAGMGLPVTFAAISRVDAVDPEILWWMRKAGCIQLSFGVESGHEATRKFLNKNIEPGDILSAFAATTDAGILPRAYFIYGCPGEGEEVIRANLETMDAIRPLAAVFYMLDLFPGTALYEDFKRRTGTTDHIWLERAEGLAWVRTDPSLSVDTVLSAGRRLREYFARRLPDYALAANPSAPGLEAEHADFLSRLGMTFLQGEYAALPRAMETAEELFSRSLSRGKDARACLGLGMAAQRRRNLAESIEVLERGATWFPRDENLAVCLAVSLLSSGRPEEALKRLSPFSQSPQARHWAARCRQAMERRGPGK
ncbi:MAG: B12-binding domain-containing radical SAM protein [Deltaproteobacteria bacterium]|nr:B12-binding domain-containing radical SAM protein [Deltaproteobacteria bacterium]